MKKHCGSVEAFEYDGIKVEWTPKEKATLDSIRKRNAEEDFNNGNGSNSRQTSGTLPYARVGKDVFGVREKWKHDLSKGIRDV